jgi:hypothetical protein
LEGEFVITVFKSDREEKGEYWQEYCFLFFSEVDSGSVITYDADGRKHLATRHEVTRATTAGASTWQCLRLAGGFSIGLCQMVGGFRERSPDFADCIRILGILKHNAIFFCLG